MATFAQQINNLAQRTGEEIKADRQKLGTLTSLTTTAKDNLVNAINEVQMAAAAAPDSADEIAYTSYGKTTVQEALDDLLYQPIAITSFSNNVNTVEMGSTVTTVTLNWRINKTPKTLKLDNEAQDVSATSKVLSGLSITTNKSWTLVAADERSATSSKSTSVTFQNGVYYGVGTVTSSSGVTNDFVKGMTKNLAGSRGKTFTVTANAGQYIYYCYPSRMGKATFNVGGFDGGFTLLHTFSYTNSSGYAEEYYVYKSENANLGQTTVLVK